jgi:hypothetical protein
MTEFEYMFSECFASNLINACVVNYPDPATPGQRARISSVCFTLMFFKKYYADDELLHCGHVYNIYIRVKTLRTSGNRYYRLIVDGFRLDVPFDVTLMPSTRPDKLIRLGRRLSANIGINFFDCEDSSTRHVIRHRRPEKFTS